MGKLAFLFAGQGAQQPGMGKELYDHNAHAKAVFDQGEALRPGTLDDCFAATPERLAQTDVTQPCVYTVALAAAAALSGGGVQPDGVAGFSLGELAALTFAGAFGGEAGFGLVCSRGQLMQQAAVAHPGGMAAVLRLPAARVEELCAGFSAVWPANYNCEGQLVVAGESGQLAAFCEAAKEAGAAVKMLATGGAFHTPLMREAADAFAKELAQSGMNTPLLPVYANRTAGPYEPPYEETLAKQIVSPVRFEETLRNMGRDGYDTFIEVGPGRVLSGLVKRTLPGATLANVQDLPSLAAALEVCRARG